MTPASDLRVLIAKLEAAKEGSRELDHEIERATDDKVWGCWVPLYSSSVDAALTLTKPSDYWSALSGPEKYLNIPAPIPNYWRAMLTYGDQPPYHWVEAWGATEALCRCACILRARLAEMKEDDR